MADDSLLEKPEPPAVEPESALGQAQEAVVMLSCPYFRNLGACETGCYSEPACQVNEPGENGWARQLRDAGEEILRGVGRG